MATRILTPAKEAAAWAVAQRLGEFGYAALAAETRIDMRRIGDLVRRWVAEGAVADLGKVGNSLHFAVVAGARPAEAPAPRTSTEALWFAIRSVRGDFSPVDIAVLCATPVDRDTASAYCQMLAQAGYLRVVRKASPPARPAVYRLVRNTGIRPPRRRSLWVVWDDNLGQPTHIPGGDA